jgi:hypothetical protein
VPGAIDLDASVSLLQPQETGPPQIFVSHAWSNSWGLLVLGLQAYAEFYNVSAKKLTCWIDIFVINQHNYMQELQQLDTVIEVCRNFIQIIDSESALPLGRVWCLYEVMSRIKHKKTGGLTVAVASITPPPAIVVSKDTRMSTDIISSSTSATIITPLCKRYHSVYPCISSPLAHPHGIRRGILPRRQGENLQTCAYSYTRGI